MLGRHQLYMLPTRHGIYFSLVLIAMLLAAVNYNNGMAYMFTFLLGASVLVSMLYTHKNLVGLEVQPGHAAPVFAGDNATFTVHLNNSTTIKKSTVCVQETNTKNSRFADIEARQVTDVQLVKPTYRRGYLSHPSITVTSLHRLNAGGIPAVIVRECDDECGGLTREYEREEQRQGVLQCRSHGGSPSG